MAKKAKKKLRKHAKRLRRHTHAQYVALRNNEDRLIGERFTALLFASSFLAVVWATGDSIGEWGRLAVAFFGLVVTILIWRMNFRSAQAADDWRSLAIEEERRIYFAWYSAKIDFSGGPYGLRMEKDQKRGRSTLERAWRRLRWPGLGHTNVLSAFFVPIILAFWWIFAIVYTFHHEFETVHRHEVTDSIDNEADQTTPNHPD